MRRIKRWHRKKRKTWRWVIIGMCIAAMTAAIVFAVLDKNTQPVSGSEEEIAGSLALTEVQEQQPIATMTPMPIETPALGDVYAGDTPTLSNNDDADDVSPDFTEPLIYQTDDGFYMTNGELTTKLIGASQDEDEEFYTLIRGQTSNNNEYLFYIKDYDDETQRGDLMRVSTSGADQPEFVARDMVSYKLSQDGTRAMVTDTDGNLYTWASDIGAKYVTDGFLGSKYTRYGFSPNGNGIYYVIDNDDGVCLYVKKGSADTQCIAQQPSVTNIRTWMGYTELSPLGDNAAILYRVSDENYENEQLYMYTPDGETTLIGACDSVLHTFGRIDDFVYESDQGILYKAPGHNPQLLWPNAEAEAIFTNDKRFLLMDDDNNSNVLYDITLGKDKIKIAQTDKRVVTNQDFSRLVYIQDNVAYIVHKQDGQWTPSVRFTDLSIHQSEHIGGIWFDNQDKYMYFMAINDTSDTRDVYRYSLETGNTRLLLENADMFFMIGDKAFATDADGDCYLLYRGLQKQAKNVFAVEPADGGAYLIRDNTDEENELIEILYYDIKTGETTTIADDVTEVFDELWY